MDRENRFLLDWHFPLLVPSQHHSLTVQWQFQSAVIVLLCQWVSGSNSISLGGSMSLRILEKSSFLNLYNIAAHQLANHKLSVYLLFGTLPCLR